jgi:hypothetical protein
MLAHHAEDIRLNGVAINQLEHADDIMTCPSGFQIHLNGSQSWVDKNGCGKKYLDGMQRQALVMQETAAFALQILAAVRAPEQSCRCTIVRTELSVLVSATWVTNIIAETLVP